MSGIGAIGAPALLLLAGRQHFSTVMAVATQASLPVAVAITSSSADSDGELQRRLGPALLALAGALLVLPVGLPQSSEEWNGFLLYLAAVSSSGVSSVLCHREMLRMARGAGLLLVLVGNTLFLSISAAVWVTVLAQRQSFRTAPALQNVASILLTAVSITLLVALLQLLTPMASASRVIFAPLISALEAYVLLRPTLSMRTACGALLMLLGGLLCLNAEQKQSASGDMSLR